MCIEASGAAAALNEAIRACAYSSKVVALGFFQGHAQGLFLGEEFHHNRVNIVCSQISGQAPELQHRWNGLRLAQTFMRLAVEGKLQLRPLITHVMPAAEAPALFKLLDEHLPEVLQAVLDFREELPPSVEIQSPKPVGVVLEPPVQSRTEDAVTLDSGPDKPKAPNGKPKVELAT